MLWVATAYLIKKGKYRFGSVLTAIPAAFMTAVSVTYILTADEGFKLGTTVSYIVGAAAVLFAIYAVLPVRRLRAVKEKNNLNIPARFRVGIFLIKDKKVDKI